MRRFAGYRVGCIVMVLAMFTVAPAAAEEVVIDFEVILDIDVGEPVMLADHEG